MGNRLDLHDIFVRILGSSNVYFQPPESTKMAYPCIRYELSGIDVKRADDIAYASMRQYTVTLIDPDPDCEYIDQLLALKYCSFDRSFTADDLNHYVFTIYY